MRQLIILTFLGYKYPSQNDSQGKLIIKIHILSEKEIL